jgi:anti-sigma factor RsiW
MEPRCEEIRQLAPELALGIVEGEERGRVLQHLADCPECRAEVDRLSEVADELLLLAPHREPPPGFESGVLGGIRPPAPRRRRWLRPVLAPVAAALAAAAIVLAIVAPDLRLASHYRETLDQANGKEFESYALRGAGGAHVGTVFSYEGSPSWLHVDVDAGHRAGLSKAHLVTDDGDSIALRWFQLDPGGGSGGSMPVDPARVSVLRLSGRPGAPSLVARFGS